MQEKTRKDWPEAVREAAGAWADFPSAETLRRTKAKDTKREALGCSCSTPTRRSIFFNGEGVVAAKLLGTPPDEVAVSTISLYELETGLRKSASPAKRRKQFDAFIGVAQVWELDRASAASAADIRAALEAKGQPIGPLDTLIAGIAVAHAATLVTRNLREFRRVAKLRTVDWYS